MTVQEFFSQLNKKEFIKYYCEEYDKHTPIRKYKETISKLFDGLLEATPKVDSNCIIFSIPEPGSILLNSFLVHKDELFKDDNPEHYGYELSKMTEILGYEVSNACIYYIDNFQLAASILYEMTFFGFDINTQDEKSKEMMETITESIEQIENNTATCIPADDVFSKYYQDTRSSYEKDFDSERYRIEGELCCSLRDSLYKLEKEYLKPF